MSRGTEQFSPSTTGAACSTTDDVKSKAGEIKQNVQDLGSSARRAAQEKMDTLKQSAGQYLEQGREQLDSLKHTASDYMEQGRERAMQMERSLESQIRMQPLRAVLIAAGIGLVAGVLFSRR